MASSKDSKQQAQLLVLRQVRRRHCCYKLPSEHYKHQQVKPLRAAGEQSMQRYMPDLCTRCCKHTRHLQ
jgi:hypothetical protein